MDCFRQGMASACIGQNISEEKKMMIQNYLSGVAMRLVRVCQFAFPEYALNSFSQNSW